jgi:hypothetical protein
MTSKQLDAPTIIALHKKYNKDGEFGNLMDYDITAVKVSQIKDPSKTTYYIPINFKNENGEKIPVSFKFARQVIMGRPFKKKAGEEEKNDKEKAFAWIKFRRISEDDLKMSDYTNTELNRLHENFVKKNEEFLEANHILMEEYLALTKRLIEAEHREITIKKEVAKGFRIDYRNYDAEKDNKGDIVKIDGQKLVKIDNPIYRYSLPIDKATSRIGYFSDYVERKKFVNVVYDAKKSNGKKREAAKVGNETLNINNVNDFITYLSCAMGIVNFRSISVHPQGISLKGEIRELHIISHSKMQNQNVGDEEFDELDELCKMTKAIVEDPDKMDDIVNSIEVKTSAVDNETNTGVESNIKEELSNVQSAKQTKKVKSSKKVKKVVSDDEPEENAEDVDEY